MQARGILLLNTQRRRIAMKTCSKCKTEKPLDAFPLSLRRKDGTRFGDGHRAVCKACDNAYAGRRKATLDDDALERKRQYHRRKSAEWMQRNHYIHRARIANLAAKRRGADGILTPKDVQIVWDKWDGKCWICGDVADQLDHYRPINKNAGGTNTADNVRPACKDCNHKRSHRWHGDTLAAQEAVLLRQLKELLK